MQGLEELELRYGDKVFTLYRSFILEETISPQTDLFLASLHSPLPDGSFQCQSKCADVEKIMRQYSIILSATSTSGVAAACPVQREVHRDASHSHAKIEICTMIN